MEALLNYDAEFHARLSELVKGNRKLIIDEIARIESSYCNFLRILIEVFPHSPWNSTYIIYDHPKELC